jgi:hypothetical protein
MSFARLLHLAGADTLSPARVKISWYEPPDDHQPIACAMSGQSKPPTHNEPPPF